MEPFDPETQSWLNSLSQDAYPRAVRILSMPGGNMAIAFVDYEMNRSIHEIKMLIRERQPKPFSKKTTALLFALGAAFAQGAISVVTRMLN